MYESFDRNSQAEIDISGARATFERECQSAWPNASFLLAEKSDASFPEQLERHIAHSDILCIFTASENEKAIQRVLAEALFLKPLCYALTPNYSAVRWIVPLDNRRATSASLRLYSPTSLKGKIFKQIAGSLAYFGVRRVWGRDRLIVGLRGGEQSGSLTGFLQDLLGESDIYIAFSTGTPGHYRKTTVQVMSKDGRTLAYAKIAYTPQAQRLLTQEAKVLRRLAELPISKGIVPRPIYAGQFYERELLVQSASSVKTHNGPDRLDIRHIEFLAEVFNQTSTQRTLLESEYWNRIRKDVDALQGQVSDDWQRRLQDGLGICKSAFVDIIMPLGLCHRDFVPWNMQLEQGRLYVFDWEYAIEQCIPFWDVFHFVFFPSMLVCRSSGKKVISCWRSKQLRQFLVQYVDKTGVDASLVPVCFLLYLIDLCCFYLNMFTRDGLWDKQRQRMQMNWLEILDELMINWEIYWGQWQ